MRPSLLRVFPNNFDKISKGSSNASIGNIESMQNIDRKKGKSK